MPGFGHGDSSKAARDKRRRMRGILSKYGWARAAQKGGSLPVAKSPVPPAPLANPFRLMPRDDVAMAFLRAVLKDDIGSMNLVHAIYPNCADWKVEAKGSSIGGEPITTPIIFYAVDGSGEALQWLIERGADLTARSNFVISPVAAFAVSKNRGQSVAAILLAMQTRDIKVDFFGKTFDHLSQVADYYGHADLASKLESVRLKAVAPDDDARVVTPALEAPRPVPRRKTLDI